MKFLKEGDIIRPVSLFQNCMQNDSQTLEGTQRETSKKTSENFLSFFFAPFSLATRQASNLPIEHQF